MAGIFDTAALAAAVTETLTAANVPAGDRHAFVLAATTGGGAKAVFASRLNDVWELDAIVSASPGQHVEGGVFVKATW